MLHLSIRRQARYLPAMLLLLAAAPGSTLKAAGASDSKPAFKLKSSPFEVCQDAAFISHQDFEKNRETFEACGVQVSPLPDNSFFHTVMLKLGTADEISREKEFVRKVAQRTLDHVDLNNLLTEHMIHCARGDHAWFEAKLAGAKTEADRELFAYDRCHAILDQVKQTIQQVRPQLRQSLALSRYDDPTITMEFSKRPEDLIYGEMRSGLAVVVPPGMEKLTAEEFTKAKERFEDDTKQIAATFDGMFEKHQERMKDMRKQGMREADVRQRVPEWVLSYDPKKRDVMPVYIQYLTQERQRLQRAYRDFYMHELLPKAPILAFLGKKDPTDADIADAAEKQLKMGQSEKKRIADLIAKVDKSSSSDQGKTKDLMEFMTFGPMVREVLAENRDYCVPATGLANYISMSKNRDLAYGFAASIGLGAAVTYFGPAILAGTPLAGLSTSSLISLSGLLTTVPNTYKDYKKYVDMKERVFSVPETVNVGTAVADMKDFESARNGLELNLAINTVMLLASDLPKDLYKIVKTTYFTPDGVKTAAATALEAALKSKGMAQKEIDATLLELASGDKTRAAKATALAVKTLGLDDDEVKFFRAAAANGVLDVKAGSSKLTDPVFLEIAKLNREDRRKVYLAAYKTLTEANPTFAAKEAKRKTLEGIVAATQLNSRTGVTDPDGVANLLNTFATSNYTPDQMVAVLKRARLHANDADVLKLATPEARISAAISKSLDVSLEEMKTYNKQIEAYNVEYQKWSENYQKLQDAATKAGKTLEEKDLPPQPPYPDSSPRLIGQLTPEDKPKLADAMAKCLTGKGDVAVVCTRAFELSQPIGQATRWGTVEYPLTASKDSKDAIARFAKFSQEQREILFTGDSDIRTLRFVNPVDYENAPEYVANPEIYGVDNWVAWKDADDYLRNIPKGKFDPTVALMQETHRRASQGLNPWLKALDKVIPDGYVPSKGGVLKARDSVGKYPLTHPLSDKELKAIKDNPYLHGFDELPLLSGPNAHRGWIHYAPHDQTEAKLKELISWYHANDGKMDPVELAAKFQYYYVSIHPMVDGNGRTSRLLMDRILMEHGLPPALIKNTEVDILLPVDEYVKEVRQGVDRFLTIAEGQGKQVGNQWLLQKNESLGALSLELARKTRFATKLQAVANTKVTIDHKIFTISIQDGMLYDEKGVPYMVHDQRLYPLSDRTYRLFEMNTPRARDASGRLIGAVPLTAEHEKAVNLNLDLMTKAKESTFDASKFSVEPYSTIAQANKTDDLYLYQWQHDLMAQASRIDATDPRDVLRPFRMNKTMFDAAAASPGRAGVDQPYLVLAQYEMADRYYYDLQREAQKNFPDLLPSVMESRRKLHTAARQLLEPYQQARNALTADKQMLVSNEANVKLFDAYLKESKLSYASFDDAMKKVDDRFVTLLRSDSNAVNYIGYLNHTDFVAFFNKLPMHEKIRKMLFELEKFLNSPAGDAKARALIQSIQEKAKKGESIYGYLPENIRKMCEELEQYYNNAKTALDYVTNTLLGNKYANRLAGDEYERQFVLESLHAGGGGLKDSKSFTSNTNLMISFPFAYGAEDKHNVVSVAPQIAMVRIPKDVANVNYGTNTFPNEYEFLAHQMVGPNHILQTWSKDQLAPALENGKYLTDDVKGFLRNYFAASYQ